MRQEALASQNRADLRRQQPRVSLRKRALEVVGLLFILVLLIALIWAFSHIAPTPEGAR